MLEAVEIVILTQSRSMKTVKPVAVAKSARLFNACREALRDQELFMAIIRERMDEPRRRFCSPK